MNVVTQRLRRVAIIAVPPVRTLDVFGPAEVFADANRLHGGEPAYEVEIISATEDQIVASHIGTPILAHRTYRELHSPVDTLLVAGVEETRELRYSPDFLGWLREQSTNVRRLGSVCTGALVLAEADLLDGRRATTHWNWCSELVRKHPLVKVDPEPIYVRDNNVYTSAGVTAGIDLALALVEEDLGGSLALQVARMMVVFLRRPGGQSQFSATLAAQTCGSQPLRELLAWMADNVKSDLSVALLARRAAMSPRNFARVFTQEVGETPARHVENIRLEAARQQLETTSLSLDEVADISGFRSAEILRRTFARRLGVTPGQYRTVFRSTGWH
ncbi:MAG: GlxA family transcriptional regulator [Chroococcidiopsidaceae cyanobacterium CP_BM_ER_R8_30]|nr:GlxA family transcriptional regulator [Chroococcidiopsidaceae cyanobacterium CP_BM_ER_R8_30]